MIISILLAPVADCTNEYTFHRTKYQAGDRGNRHLDGFVDCEAASEGNQYYVEDFDLSTANDETLCSCFKPDGLCLNLTRSWSDGWAYYVGTLLGNNNNSIYGLTSEYLCNMVESYRWSRIKTGYLHFSNCSGESKNFRISLFFILFFLFHNIM